MNSFICTAFFLSREPAVKIGRMNKMDKNRTKKVKYIILLFSVFLFSLSLISVSLASASSEIQKWNSVTGDASDSFPVDVHIGGSAEVEFTVSSDLSYEWTWSVNKEEIEEYEGESSNLVYVFEEYGIYNVSVVGQGENETIECACWNVTVWLVIEEENDVRELEGLEAYTLWISKKPERIISMAPSCTEVLFAAGAGDSVVGVTEYCDFPPEVEGIEKIGGYSTPSLEKIVALEPDLIVGAYGNPADVIYWLIDEEAHPGIQYPVYSMNPKNIEEILAHIKVTGAITKYEGEASSLVDNLRERLDEVEEQTDSLEEEQRPRVFYNIGTFFTAGDDTFINEIIETAGGTNIAADKSGYFIMNLEVLIDKNPQVIICDSGMGSISTAYEEIMYDERLEVVDAVKNNRVYVIEGDIMDRPGPRVVDALEIVHDDFGDFFAAMKEEDDEDEDPPSITAWNPVEAMANNTEGESRTFSVSVDQTVDISWQINGTEIQTDESVVEAAYTNASAAVGTWQVSAIATNRATGLSEMHTWIWNVTPVLTATPTPVVNITATPSPTPSPSSTSKSAPSVAPAPTSTPAQASTPKTEENQKSGADGEPVQGFEAVIAIIALLAVVYLLRRTNRF